MARKYVEGFNSIFDFHRQRSWLAVIGYLLVHVIVADTLAAASGQLISIFFQGMEPAKMHVIGVKLAKLIVTVYVAALYALIVHYRKEWKNPRYDAGLAVIVVLGLLNVLFYIPPPPISLLLVPAITPGLRIRKKKDKEETA